MTKKVKNCISVLVLVVAAFTCVMLLKKVSKRPVSDGKQNPYEYNVDDLKKVTPKLVSYKEIEPIKVTLKTLRGIAVDKQDRIYVTGDQQLLIYDNEKKSPTIISVKGNPSYLTVSPNNDIYAIVDNTIVVFDQKGVPQKMWKLNKKEAIFTSVGVSDDFVFVADAGNKVVWKLNKQGEIVAEIGRKNKELGVPPFIIPSPYFDLLVGKDQSLWVVNPGEHKLEYFKFDGSLISTWGEAGTQIEKFCGCCNPTHIARLSDGSFVTSEKGLVRVKVYDAKGEFVCVVAGPDQFAEDTVGLDLAVDNRNRILVLDPARQTIRIFVRK